MGYELDMDDYHYTKYWCYVCGNSNEDCDCEDPEN